MPERFPSRQATLIRLLALLQVFLLLASLFAPIPALAADPSADPSATPAATDPAPSQDPTASPDPSVAPDPSPSADPAPAASDAPSAAPDPSPSPSDALSADPSPTDPAPAPSADPTPAPVVDPTPAPATTRYIVAFDPGTTAATRAAVLGVDGATLVDSIAPLGLYVVDTVDGSGAYTSIANDPAVLRVDLDRERAAEALPDDPGAAGQWALETIGWTSVFDTVTPSGAATVAVLDTGVDASLADLAGALVGGISVLDGSAGTTDPNGHGTAMASIIAAATGNGTGIAGVGYAGVRVMPVTVLGADGTGQDSDVIAGIVWAVQHGADVINMSFSNPGYSASLQAAIDWAWSNGAVIVAATGNDGSSAVTFPAGDRGVVGVSATDRTDAIASWSNRGTDVFLAAPGEGVSALDRDGGIVSIDGTSASSAIVAAAAALLRANDPGASNGVIVGRLARSADAVGTASETGNGRLNLARALGDAGTDVVKPAGAAPVGDGGPFVGPYTVAACTVSAVSVGSQSAAVAYGTGASVNFAITLTKSNGNCNGSFSVSGLPASVTFSFSPSTFSGSGTSKTSTLTLTTTNATPAGSISFTVAAGGSDTNGSVSGTGTLTVGKVTLNVNAVAASKTYGNVDPTFAWTYSGFVGSDNAGNTAISGTASCSRTGDNNVGGTKTITCAPGSLSAANYSFATGTSAALTINKRQLAVNAVANGKTYGQVDPALSATLSGFAGTDNATNSSITGAASCSRTAGETVALSPYAITCGPGTLSAPNYSFATGSTALFAIGKATLNVNASAASKTYGDPDPTFTWTYSGFVSPDNAGNTTITGSASCTRTGDNNVAGTKTITCAPGTLSAANYAFATGTTAALTINKRQLAVDAVATGKTYGQADPVLTATLSGFTGTDNATNSSITGTASCSRTAGETVALSPYTITCAPGTLSAPNYSFATGATAQFAIAKAVLDVDAIAASKTYGDADPAFTWTYSGFAGSDNAGNSAISGAASCTRTGDNHVAGTKTITCAPGTLSAPNYSFATGASAAFTIDQRPVGVTADPQTKVYGDADRALTYQVTSGSVVPGDAFTGALTRDPGEIVASYAITQGTLDLGPDYALSFTGAQLSITKAPSTVTVTCPSTPEIYTGGTIEPCTASATGVNLTLIDVTGSIVYGSNINVGTANAFAEWSGDDNHFGDTGSAKFEIAKAPSTTVVTCPSSVIYDATAQTPCTVSVTGAGGLSLTPDPVYADNTNAGTATASYSYLGDANHDGSSDSKTFTISKAPSVVSVTCTGPNTFTGAAIEPCTAVATGVGISTPGVLSVSYTDNVHAGTAHASATWAGDANHDGNTGNQTFTIDKAPSTVTVTCPTSVEYTAGAQEPCNAEATGVAMIPVNLTGDIDYADNIVVGTASASASWLGDPDHEGDSGFATFEITKAPLTITAHDQTKTYGTAFTFAGTEFDAATLLGSDSVDSVTLTSAGSAATATVNGGPYAIVASDAVGTGLENYQITYVDGELSVTQAAAACTIAPYGGTYDGDAHEATGGCVDVFGEPLDGLDLSGTARRNAGSYSNLPWSFSDPDGNYADTDGTTTASIARAALDLYATPDTKTYDRTTTSSATPTTGPLQGTDSVTGLVQAFDSAAAGARTLAITAYTVNDGASGGNYAVTLHPAAGTIGQAPLTVTFTVDPKTYDATTDATIAGCDVTGGIAPDDVTCDASGATASFADAHAGTGKPVTGSGFGLLGADAANYAITTIDPASGDIAKAAPVCTVTGYAVTYDGDDHTATGSCLGVEGETLAGLDLTGTTHRDAGSYTDGWTFTDGTGDYVDDAGSVSSTIDQAPLAITPDDDSKVYGTAWTPSGTGFTTSSLAPGDSVATVTLASTGAPAGASVVTGGYPITASGATGTGLANYSITYGTGTLTVTKATATIVATGWSGTYDANPHTISVTATGVPGEDLSAGITLGASIRNAPGGTVSWSFSDPTGNHEDASGSAAVVIGKAPLALNAVPDTKVADGTTSSTGTPTVVTLLGTDSITGLVQAFDSSAAGARILSVQSGYIVSDGNGGANYAVSLTPAAGTINPGPAHHLVFLQQPTGGVTNAPLSPSIIVGVRDAYDNVVTGAGRAITLSLYDPFPEAAWIMGTTTVATAADGTATFTDIAIDTPGTFVLEATSAGVTSDFSNPVSINAGTLFADIATGDADWQNEVDGVDVLFAKTGTGSTTKYTLKATNPATFKYRLSLTNETGSDIHVKGSALPEILRDGVSLKNRNGASAAVILTVPSMPSLLGTDSPLTPAQATQPAFMLSGSHPVHVNPDDRSDDMPVTVFWVAELPSGVTSCEQVTTWNTSPLADGAVVRCLKVEGLAIPRHHQARISVAYEFRWKNTAGWGSATSDASTAFRAGFSFVSVTQIALDAFPADLDTHAHSHWGRLPSALRAKLLSDFAALWGRTYKGYSALGLAFAGEKVTALGGFLFDTQAQGLRDVTVRVFSVKPAGNACQAGLAYGTNGYVADATTATDGFWFIWQKNVDNSALVSGTNTLPSGSKYVLALCDMTGDRHALPFDQLYWPTRTMDHTLGSKEFDEEDFFVSGPTRLEFQQQPLTGRKGQTLGTVKVALLDGFGNVMTMDSSSKVTLSATTSTGTSTALSSTSTQPLVDRVLTNGTATWTGLKLGVAGTYKLLASSSITGVSGAASLAISISN